MMRRCYGVHVRTTLTIEDDVLMIAKSMASAKGTSVGRILSDLARRGLRGKRTYADVDGLPSFEVKKDATPITLEDVKKWEDEP